MKISEASSLLGVTTSDPEATIRRAFRKTMLRVHPDKNPGEAKAQAEKEARRVSEAMSAFEEYWEGGGGVEGVEYEGDAKSWARKYDFSGVNSDGHYKTEADMEEEEEGGEVYMEFLKMMFQMSAGGGASSPGGTGGGLFESFLFHHSSNKPGSAGVGNSEYGNSSGGEGSDGGVSPCSPCSPYGGHTPNFASRSGENTPRKSAYGKEENDEFLRFDEEARRKAKEANFNRELLQAGLEVEAKRQEEERKAEFAKLPIIPTSEHDEAILAGEERVARVGGQVYEKFTKLMTLKSMCKTRGVKLDVETNGDMFGHDPRDVLYDAVLECWEKLAEFDESKYCRKAEAKAQRAVDASEKKKKNAEEVKLRNKIANMREEDRASKEEAKRRKEEHAVAEEERQREADRTRLAKIKEKARSMYGDALEAEIVRKKLLLEQAETKAMKKRRIRKELADREERRLMLEGIGEREVEESRRRKEREMRRKAMGKYDHDMLAMLVSMGYDINKSKDALIRGCNVLDEVLDLLDSPWCASDAKESEGEEKESGHLEGEIGKHVVSTHRGRARES